MCCCFLVFSLPLVFLAFFAFASYLQVMASIAVLIATALFVIFVLSWLVRHFRFRQIVNKIPGPRASFPFGNALQLRLDPDDFFDQICGSCEMFVKPVRMCRVWLLMKPYILIYGADEVEAVSTNQTLINKSDEYRFLHDWLGLGLLTAPSGLWRPRRKQLTPTFHYDILKDFLDVFNAQSRVLCDKLLPHAIVQTPFDIYSSITLCALDIICETAMGRHVSAQTQTHNEYVEALYDIARIVHLRQKRPWLWPQFMHYLFGDGFAERKALNILHGFTNKVIKERRTQIEQAGGVDKLETIAGSDGSGKRRLAFLDMLLELVRKGEMEFNDVRPEVDTFMMEGHDTTSAGMTWLIHLLGNYPECQAKVHRELDEVFGDSDRNASVDDLNQLKYLEACIKEALRLFPPVPMYAREVVQDVTIRDYVIPAGTTLSIIPYMVHRDPSIWPDPEMFNPDRFMDNNVRRHPYAHVPFSAGSRQRFALMEEKTVMSWLFRHYSVESKQRRDQIRAKAELILRTCNGVMVVLRPRQLAKYRRDSLTNRNTEEATDKILVGPALA